MSTVRRRTPVVGAAGWLVVAGASASGVVSLSLIDQVVVLGVAVVLPLALDGRWWWWEGAAGAVVVAFACPVGPAGVLVVPLGLVTACVAVDRVRQVGPLLFWRLHDGAEVLASLFAVVAAGALAVSRSGGSVLGVREPIVELTAVHYIFAGSAALVLARLTLGETGDRGGRWARAGRAAVACTAIAPPVVALGFVTHAAVFQVGGAVLMTLGVWLTAGVHLRRALTSRPSVAGAFLLVSGLAVWVPMMLAVAWAAGQHWRIPVLSVPDMARTHGLVNALAFVLCGLVGRRLGAPDGDGAGDGGGSGPIGEGSRAVPV